MSRWEKNWWGQFPFDSFGLDDSQTVVDQMDETMDYMLTHLEMMESHQMIYGLYDSSMKAEDWVAAFLQANPTYQERNQGIFTASMQALYQLGWIIALELKGPILQWTFRSRAAEVARLLTKLRQRFEKQTYSYQSKTLVGNVKFDVKPRVVPKRDRPLDEMLETIEKKEYQWIVAMMIELLVDRDKHGSGQTFQVSGFQLRSFQTIVDQYLNARSKATGVVVTAGTGSGKTLSFFIPALFQVLVEKYNEGKNGVKVLSLYPRTRLANNQLQEYVSLLRKMNHLLNNNGKKPITIGLEGQFTPQQYMIPRVFQGMMTLKEWEMSECRGERAIICPWLPSDCCVGGKLVLLERDCNQPVLRCSTCFQTYEFLCVTKEQLRETPPDFLLGVTESIGKRLMSSRYQNWFGLGESYTSPGLIMLDEIHLQSSISGMQTGYFLRRLLHRIQKHRNDHGIRRTVQVVGLSATIGEPIRFFHELTGLKESDIQLVAPLEEEMRTFGAEYFYFIQADRKGEASMLAVLIQSAMCLIHNLHPDHENNRRYKGFGFVNSRDIAYRWKEDMEDAEKNRLYALRGPQKIQTVHGKKYLGLPPHNCESCTKSPDTTCSHFQQGECWWPMHSGGNLNKKLDLKAVTSLGGGNLDDLDLIISTSTLEVGYDDPSLMTVIQHQAPVDIASFVQRKGRGGRQAGTRPVMLTVLSPHASMDQFYFNNTHVLTDPVFQKMPLNPQNSLVQRVHGFFAIMDYLAYRAAMEGHDFDIDELHHKDLQFLMHSTSTPDNNDLMKRYVDGALDAFPQAVYYILTDSKDGIFSYGLPTFVQRLNRELHQKNNGRKLKLTQIMNDYVPQNMFSDIQLPEIEVQFENDQESDPSMERIEMALGEAQPGRVSFRWKKPLWIVPNGQLSVTDPNLLFMNPDVFMSFVQSDQELKIPVRKLPTPHRKLLKGGLSGINELTIVQPNRVQYKEFGFLKQESQGDLKGKWEFDPRSNEVKPSNNPAKDKLVDRRSGTSSLASYHLEWPSVPATDTPRIRSFMYHALQRVSFAENRPDSEFLKVQKVFAGYQLALKYGEPREQKERHFSIMYRNTKGELVAPGYELITEAIGFEFSDRMFEINFSIPLENVLCWKYFHTLIENDVVPECNVSTFTLSYVIQALSLSATLRGIPQRSPVELLDSLDFAHWEFVVTSHLGVASYIEEAILELQTNDLVWEKLREKATQARITPMVDLVYDPLMMTLSQVLKKATQVITGVEIRGDITAHTSLMMHDGERKEPMITLFELGMRGTGVIKTLRQVLDSRPEIFWNQVEREAFHCDQGDEEIFVKALLRLPEQQIETIASLIQKILKQTSIKGRNIAIEKLTEHLRIEYGCILQPQMIRILRIVFAQSPEPDLSDKENLLQGVENWRLYRELYEFADRLEMQFERELDPFVIVEMFVAHLEDNQDGSEQWHKMKSFVEYHAKTSATNLETIRINVQDPKKTLYKAVFSQLTKKEVGQLVDMEEWECKEELLKRFPVIKKEWVTAFYQSAFAKENGYAVAFLYWAFVHDEVHDESHKAIEQQSRFRLKEVIRSRLLRTCLDGCPSCLHMSSDLVGRNMLPHLVSQRLLREFLQQLWRRDEMLVDLTEESLLRESKVKRIIERFFAQGEQHQIRIWHLPNQIEVIHKAIGKLIADGVKGVTTNTYDIGISGVRLRKYDFVQGPTHELTVTLQELRGR